MSGERVPDEAVLDQIRADEARRLQRNRQRYVLRHAAEMLIILAVVLGAGGATATRGPVIVSPYLPTLQLGSVIGSLMMGPIMAAFLAFAAVRFAVCGVRVFTASRVHDLSRFERAHRPLHLTDL